MRVIIKMEQRLSSLNAKVVTGKQLLSVFKKASEPNADVQDLMQEAGIKIPSEGIHIYDVTVAEDHLLIHWVDYRFDNKPISSVAAKDRGILRLQSEGAPSTLLDCFVKKV